MKIIKVLAERIEDELKDADTYIELAMAWKNEEPKTAQLFHELSLEEIGHVDKLHEDVAELITGYRQANGEPPKEMLALYDYLHEKHVGEAMRVKIKQQMYKP